MAVVCSRIQKFGISPESMALLAAIDLVRDRQYGR